VSAVFSNKKFRLAKN